MRTFVYVDDSASERDWPPDGVVVTDPPFALGKVYAGLVETRTFAQHVESTLEIPARRHVIRAPQQALQDRDVPPPTSVIIECRTFGPAKPGRRLWRWQPWLLYGDYVNTGLYDWFTIGPAFGDAQAYVRLSDDHVMGDHPGLTPPNAVAAILQRCAEPDATIIDPFAGMGGIGTVALATGFGYYGVEVIEEWAAEANRRCRIAADSIRLTLALETEPRRSDNLSMNLDDPAA